jgi:hypothetical protein
MLSGGSHMRSMTGVEENLTPLTVANTPSASLAISFQLLVLITTIRLSRLTSLASFISLSLLLIDDGASPQVFFLEDFNWCQQSIMTFSHTRSFYMNN